MMAAGLGAGETQVQILVLPPASCVAPGTVPTACRLQDSAKPGAQSSWQVTPWPVSGGRGGAYSLLRETQNPLADVEGTLLTTRAGQWPLFIP